MCNFFAVFLFCALCISGYGSYENTVIIYYLVSPKQEEIQVCKTLVMIDFTHSCKTAINITELSSVIERIMRMSLY